MPPRAPQFRPDADGKPRYGRTALPTRRKYGNTPVVIDGIKFASKREGDRYALLKLREKAGEIRNLQLQPPFEMRVNGKLICRYVADFAYFKDQERIIEDVKGFETPEFKLKAKLFEALYPGQKLELVR